MSIVAADLVAHLPANLPEDDVSTAGGARVSTSRPLDSQFAASAQPYIESDNAGDTTQTVTIEGRDTGGGVISEAKTLNGTTPVAFTNTFERILNTIISAACTGTVLIKQGSGGTTRHTFAPGELKNAIFFQRSSSSGSIEIRYEKVFLTNTHGTLTLNSAQVTLTADPDSRFRIGVHTSKDDTATITDRTTTPGGITFVDDSTAQNVPTGQLDAGEAIGVWIEQNLPASDAARKTTFTVQLSGTTT